MVAALALLYGWVIHPVVSGKFGGYYTTLGGELLLGLSCMSMIAWSIKIMTNRQ